MYKVYINGDYKSTVETEDEAWDIIGKAPFGSLFEVRNKYNKVMAEFMPY